MDILIQVAGALGVCVVLWLIGIFVIGVVERNTHGHEIIIQMWTFAMMIIVVLAMILTPVIFAYSWVGWLVAFIVLPLLAGLMLWMVGMHIIVGDGQAVSAAQDARESRWDQISRGFTIGAAVLSLLVFFYFWFVVQVGD